VGTGAAVAEVGSSFDIAGASATWTGDGYAVVWAERIASGSFRLFFQLFDDSAAPEGSAVTLTETWSQHPSLAWSGTDLAVAWMDRRAGGTFDVYFMRFDTDGLALSEEVRVTDGTANSANPRLIWTGTEHVLAWEERNANAEIRVARLDPSGAVVGEPTVFGATPGGSSDQQIVWTGSELGVAWGDGREGRFQVFFARLDSSGALTGEETPLTDAGVEAVPYSLVWTGTDFTVAYVDVISETFRVNAQRLDPSGRLLGEPLAITDGTTDCRVPRLAWTGDALGVLYSETGPSATDLVLATVRCDGGVL
jgi:hypothetical protein